MHNIEDKPDGCFEIRARVRRDTFCVRYGL